MDSPVRQRGAHTPGDYCPEPERKPSRQATSKPTSNSPNSEYCRQQEREITSTPIQKRARVLLPAKKPVQVRSDDEQESQDLPVTSCLASPIQPSLPDIPPPKTDTVEENIIDSEETQDPTAQKNKTNDAQEKKQDQSETMKETVTVKENNSPVPQPIPGPKDKCTNLAELAGVLERGLGTHNIFMAKLVLTGLSTVKGKCLRNFQK